MPINITLQGLSEAVGTLPELPKNIETLVISKMSEIVFNAAEAGAAKHSKTGALMASLFNMKTDGGRAVGHDLQHAPHALFVNMGSKQHWIGPKDKKALRWASGGNFIFSKGHMHPGYIGDAYLIHAATLALQQFNKIVDEATKEAAT